MDLLKPADRIFQPLLLPETEAGFNLRTNIGFADSAVQISHENHRRNLFKQGPVFCFHVGKLGFAGILGRGEIMCLGLKHAGQVSQHCFGIGGDFQLHKLVSFRWTSNYAAANAVPCSMKPE